ncbi:MAG TPA: flagellar filament capping protein FliD [Steroidobacteraceae bacterium]|nr:flagellar filament capping protein FliD [Steroidobacteraceae bacterium]
MPTVSSTSPTSTLTPTSVASSSSAGAAGGSVINVSNLVSQLVAATRAPQDALIANQTQTVTTEISSVGTLKSALSTFQASLSSLDTPSAFNALSASSSNTAAFTATADGTAVAGSYSVNVTQLAQGQQLVSNAVAAGSAAPVGTGTLQLSLGGSSFSLTIDSSNDTLTGIADAINAAAGNPGITAAIVTGTDGAHLVLSSALTGQANTIQVTETDAGTALSSLTYGTGNTTNYTQQSAAQDAQFSISGIPYTSASNTVTDALSGVILTLTGLTTTTTGSGATATTTSTPATLTVSSNTATIQSNISAFVSAYNTLAGTFTSLGGLDATTGTAGPMMGDALLSGIQNQIRSALYSVVNSGSGIYNSLASVGITSNADGTLKLNSTTLQNALASAPAAVSALFSGSGGVATALNAAITQALSSNGIIASRSQTLITQENALTTQTDTLNTQMAALTASLTQQYSALNTLLSSLQTTSSYLSQSFASLPTVQGKANA